MGLDIRIPLGLIFLVIGGIMAIFGLATHGDAALYAQSLGVDLNLTWGGIMAVFGAIMLFAGRRRRWQGAPADTFPGEKGASSTKAPH